jgi:hypothetical protein
MLAAKQMQKILSCEMPWVAKRRQLLHLQVAAAWRAARARACACQSREVGALLLLLMMKQTLVSLSYQARARAYACLWLEVGALLLLLLLLKMEHTLVCIAKRNVLFRAFVVSCVSLWLLNGVPTLV